MGDQGVVACGKPQIGGAASAEAVGFELEMVELGGGERSFEQGTKLGGGNGDEMGVGWNGVLPAGENPDQSRILE